MEASFGHACTGAVTADAFTCACMHACTGICIPPTVMALGDNDHTHAHSHLPSLCKYVRQTINLAHAAAILSIMVQHRNFCPGCVMRYTYNISCVLK